MLYTIWTSLEIRSRLFVVFHHSKNIPCILGPKTNSPAKRSRYESADTISSLSSEDLESSNKKTQKKMPVLQGQSWQTGFLELARNMQVRFFWKVVLKSWDLRNFATATSFHEIYTVKLFLKYKIQCFWVFWCLFVSKFIQRSTFIHFIVYLLVVAWKWPLKVAIFQNSLRN